MRKFYRIIILPYTIFMLYIMLLGFGRSQYEDNIVRFAPVLSTITFVKDCISSNNNKTLVINLVGNIVMFIPFGFLGFVSPKFQNFRNLIIAFLSAIIIVETLQYFTRMGVCEVDDILFNSFGVWIGFLIYSKFFKDKI